jgi:uncharacterized protein YkwD
VLATPSGRVRALVAVVTLCTTVVLPVAVAAPAGATVSPAAGFVADINAARTAHHLRPLKVTSDLTSVAARWAATMASKRALSHNPQLGTAIHGWEGLAENVGLGQSVPQIHAAFMNSAPHRANILDKSYTQIGVGVVVVKGQVYVVEDFRRPA